MKMKKTTRFKIPIWAAIMLSYLPGFSQPNRKDVIDAYDLLENGVDDVELVNAQDARETMERARAFYNNYASVLGTLGGLVVAIAVEGLQAQFPDIKQLKFAHIGAGAIALWIVNIMMDEYDRRVIELREKELVIVLTIDELKVIKKTV
ncbi:hypothetical protein [Vibrio nomapromontoriensis]|uniref:hypothetical protein n=1 Tax=Vibrio nomapromontoriensis TaxID=2910246 RepID=UPI003D0CBBD5